MKAKQTILFFFLLSFGITSYGQKLVEVWETSGLMTPESVLYDQDRELIFVSNVNENPWGKDGNGFISILNADGSIKKLDWVNGMSAPKGMGIFEGKLYVSDVDELIEIDIKNAKILKKYPVNGAPNLNDVAICRNGMVFVSDSKAGKIYLLKDGKLTVWLDDAQLGKTNGLFTEKGKLYIGSDKLFQADIKTKNLKLIQTNCQGIDGLEKDNAGNFVFSNWPGRIFYLEDGKMTKMVDSTAEKVNTADLDFALKLNLLLVPTFYKNSVVAYRIER